MTEFERVSKPIERDYIDLLSRQIIYSHEYFWCFFGVSDGEKRKNEREKKEK